MCMRYRQIIFTALFCVSSTLALAVDSTNANPLGRSLVDIENEMRQKNTPSEMSAKSPAGVATEQGVRKRKLRVNLGFLRNTKKLAFWRKKAHAPRQSINETLVEEKGSPQDNGGVISYPEDKKLENLSVDEQIKLCVENLYTSEWPTAQAQLMDIGHPAIPSLISLLSSTEKIPAKTSAASPQPVSEISFVAYDALHNLISSQSNYDGIIPAKEDILGWQVWWETNKSKLKFLGL